MKVVSALALLLVPSLAVAQATLVTTEHQVTTNPADQFNPAISGTRVVYTDNRNGNLDIYFTDLTTGVEGRVTSSLLDEALDGISANVIVYDQYGATVSTYGYDIGTGTTFRLSAVPSVQLNPAVGANGGIAAWADNRDGNFEIYTRNMATGVVTRGTSTPADEGHPAVSPQGRVVFESCVAGTCDILMLDPATGAVTVVANTPADERSPHIDGDSVVFDANRDGNRDIYLFNVATRIETRVLLPGVQSNPHISGDFVAFEDVTTGIPHIMLYQISTGVVSQATTNPSAQFLNDISGQRLVYTDDRNGNLDIYESDFSVSNPIPATVDCANPGSAVPLLEATFTALDDDHASCSSAGFAAPSAFGVLCIVATPAPGDGHGDHHEGDHGEVSGKVSVNGREVADDFDQALQSVGVSLNATNTLGACVDGEEGASLTVRVYAVSQPAPGAADDDEEDDELDHDRDHSGAGKGDVGRRTERMVFAPALHPATGAGVHPEQQRVAQRPVQLAIAAPADSAAGGGDGAARPANAVGCGQGGSSSLWMVVVVLGALLCLGRPRGAAAIVQRREHS